MNTISCGKVYRVKQLDWKDYTADGRTDNHCSESYCVFEQQDSTFTAHGNGVHAMEWIYFQTREQAKAACQAHYEAEMMRHLVEVEL